MKCVIDTSAISWMQEVGHLDLLPRIYETLYAPASVFKQLEGHEPTQPFMQKHVQRIQLSKMDQRDFLQRVRRWQRKRQ